VLPAERGILGKDGGVKEDGECERVVEV